MEAMKQKKYHKLVALLLVATMCFCMEMPNIRAWMRESYIAQPQEDTICISTAEELISFGQNCAYDKWSVGKNVVLLNDISLKNVDFEPIAYFAGTFDGQGYTISDLQVHGNFEPAGLFGETKQGALIKNVTVTGSVMPEGNKEFVGGIVGINGGSLLNVNFSGVVSGKVAVGGLVGLNKETGILEQTSAQGHIFGQHGTGGIVGRNLGKLVSNENKAYVNNASVDSTISLEDINTNILQSLYSLNSSDVTNTFTDTGGIAGYSSGMVLNSQNKGTIGYPHIGYNAGGIAGRNTGYIKSCTNNGKVLGRKDIGGIVGQVEPFLDIEVDISDLSVLEEQLNNLKNQVDETSANAKNTMRDVKVNLDKITDYINQASDAIKKLSSANNLNNGNSLSSENTTTEDSGGKLPHGLELPDNIEFPNGEKLQENIELPNKIELPEDIELPEIDISYDSVKETLDILSDSLNGISSELRKANKNAENGSEEVLNGLEGIYSQINIISDTAIGILDTVKHFTIEDIIADTSNIEIENVTYGKIAGCMNEGLVNGDLNSGGIAGIMSLEYELDPEDDVTADISLEERKQYEVKAILIDCTNKGEVISKKDGAGAICGQMHIGVITNCYAYGSVKSDNGDYVGGIVGIARSTVANCIANCELSGMHYVGGIIGTGYSVENSQSEVLDCYSLVKITDCKQFEGAIAGYEGGIFANNYFVSNQLQGINRVSYEGMAQPITYEALLQVTGMPNELKEFTLSFEAEGKIIKSLNFHYGDSFGTDIIPEVPKKEGYDGQWDKTDLSNLCFDTVVNAEYTSYVTVLQSESLRKNNRPIILLEGDFSKEDTVTLVSAEITGTIQSELKMSGKVMERWNISFRDDGKKRHSIRFLPEENMGHTKLYMKQNGEWTRLETTEIGSYTVFQAVGNQIELAVVSKRMELALLIGEIGFVIIFIVIGIFLEKKKHLFSNVFKKLNEKFGGKKLIMFFVAVVAVMGLFFTIYIAMLPKVRISTELAVLSADILAKENQTMRLDLSTEIGSNHMEFDTKVYVLKEGDTSVFALEEGGHTIYLSEEAIYLENGKAFHIGEAKSNATSLLEQVIKLFEATQITRTTEQDKVIYSISTTGEDAKKVLAILVPATEGQLASAQTTQIRIIASDGMLQRVEIEGNATLKDAMETSIEISAKLFDFSTLKQEYEIPQAVINAINNTESTSLEIMGEDFYRLLFAWMEFNKEEQNGIVVLNVDCGPIHFEKEHDWAKIRQNADDISNITDINSVLDLVYQICMDGKFSCEKLGDSSIFQIVLKEDAIQHLSQTIAPQIQTQVVNLTKGTLEVVVEGNKIVSITIAIDGTVMVLFSEVDASIGTEFLFE